MSRPLTNKRIKLKLTTGTTLCCKHTGNSLGGAFEFVVFEQHSDVYYGLAPIYFDPPINMKIKKSKILGWMYDEDSIEARLPDDSDTKQCPELSAQDYFRQMMM